MRFIEVVPTETVGRTSGNQKRIPLTKSEKSTKKKLLNLRPWEYFEASSNPKIGLPVRAVLQSLKAPLCYTHELLQDTLQESRSGLRPYGMKALLRLKYYFKECSDRSLREHLLTRYVHWAIGQAKSAKRVLLALGFTSQDLRDPLLRNYVRGRNGLRTTNLFIRDKEYTTGVHEMHSALRSPGV